MKIIFLILSLLTYSSAFEQDYKMIITEANNFYKNKEYKKSVYKYKEAFKIEQNNADNLYDAACSAALLGNDHLAFEWLNLAVKNGWININHLKSDNDLIVLHNSKRWDNLLIALQNEIDKIEANYDKPLQSKLIAIFEDDQGIRRQFIAAQKEFGYQSREVDSLRKIMIFKDSINQLEITKILDQYGWVGIDKVGGKANHTLFLVIQHADQATQEKYLPIMREAVKNGKAEARSLALLEDRVALGEGKRQIYGSQIGMNNETQKYYVLPLDDPDNVDRRRAEVGLSPLADYVKNWNIVWNAEEYKKQLPAIEAKQIKEK